MDINVVLLYVSFGIVDISLIVMAYYVRKLCLLSSPAVIRGRENPYYELVCATDSVTTRPRLSTPT